MCRVVYMSNTEITYTVAPYGEEATDLHTWTLLIDGDTVSQLFCHLATGEIVQVETPAVHQGLGYASRLYAHAAQQIDIFHAPESHRTHEGQCFAASVGGPALPCTYGCCDTIED